MNAVYIGIACILVIAALWAWWRISNDKEVIKDLRQLLAHANKEHSGNVAKAIQGARSHPSYKRSKYWRGATESIANAYSASGRFEKL